MTSRIASGLVLVALATASIGDTKDPARGKPRLELSEVRRDGGRVAVSFRLADALGEKALEQLKSELSGETFQDD